MIKIFVVSLIFFLGIIASAKCIKVDRALRGPFVVISKEKPVKVACTADEKGVAYEGLDKYEIPGCYLFLKASEAEKQGEVIKLYSRKCDENVGSNLAVDLESVSWNCCVEAEIRKFREVSCPKGKKNLFKNAEALAQCSDGDAMWKVVPSPSK